MVRYQLMQSRNVIFVTARKECKTTHKLIEDITGKEFKIESLSTDNIPEDKTKFIKEFGDCLFLFFDDNKEIRWRVMKELPNVLALDPVPMREVLSG